MQFIIATDKKKNPNIILDIVNPFKTIRNALNFSFGILLNSNGSNINIKSLPIPFKLRAWSTVQKYEAQHNTESKIERNSERFNLNFVLVKIACLIANIENKARAMLLSAYPNNTVESTKTSR